MKKKSKGRLTRLEMTLLLLGVFLLGTAAGMVFLTTKMPVLYSSSNSFDMESGVTLRIPAVDNSGKGVLGTLVTHVKPGTGQVLVNVADVITLGDTQQSAKDAAKAAADYMHVDPNTIDVSYDIEVNASTIEGPSAGANMALGAVLAMMNRTPNSYVMMTGTIDESGNIGPVGAVLEKATASKQGGATEFVVPTGQSTEMQTVRQRQCSNSGVTRMCRITYTSTPVNIGGTLNITVVEAGTLSQAVKYFTQ